MRGERSTGAVLTEAAMFAVMAGVVGAVAFMVLGGYGLISGAMFGGVVAAVVFVIMWLLLRGTMEPPRGPGNIKPTETPLTKGEAPKTPAAKPASPKPASTSSGSPARAGSATAATTNSGGAASPAGMAQPATLNGPRDGGADDLKKIKGVGPKLEEALHGIGIYHFDQIARWSDAEVAWVDENLVGFKGRASRDEWVAQARKLASGAETEFSRRVDEGEVY